MYVAQVARDLADEQQALDDIVAALTPDEWALATPSPGWDVGDQIGHLTYFDRAAALAVTDPAGFQGLLADFGALIGEPDEVVDEFTLRAYRELAPTKLLAAWRDGRAELAAAAAMLDDTARIAWYGPPMGAKSFLSARLMEAWAHGQDIVDTVDAARPPTDRLTHVVRLGFITRGWSYAVRGLEAPDTGMRLELEAPSGATWELGPDDAAESVRGLAVDFCLVVTQRRHLDDTGLVATPGGRDWLLIAQAYAGPPATGPAPGTRR